MNSEEIKNTIKELLNKISVDYDEVELKKDNYRAVFVIKTKDSKILIGRDGVNIYSLQHLVYKIMNKKFGREKEPFFIDVNDYYQKRRKAIKKGALKQGERACFFKHDVELEPMNAYDRMMIHSLFSENPKIETHSSGRGENRHITIFYKET